MFHHTSVTTKSLTNNPASRLTNTARTERRFCLNASCLTDEILVRKVSSFNHVWLLTDTSDNTSWLVNMETPVCPCWMYVSRWSCWQFLRIGLDSRPFDKLRACFAGMTSGSVGTPCPPNGCKLAPPALGHIPVGTGCPPYAWRRNSSLQRLHHARRRIRIHMIHQRLRHRAQTHSTLTVFGHVEHVHVLHRKLVAAEFEVAAN